MKPISSDPDAWEPVRDLKAARWQYKSDPGILSDDGGQTFWFATDENKKMFNAGIIFEQWEPRKVVNG